jgi:hypothetical protein
MTERPDSSKPSEAPADRLPRARSAEEACANLEKLGITEDDVADAVRWARSNPIGDSERWNSSKS